MNNKSTYSLLGILLCLIALPVCAGGPYAVTGIYTSGVSNMSEAGGYCINGAFASLSPKINTGSQYTCNGNFDPLLPNSTWSKTLILCDYNFDYHVNIVDLGVFISHWLDDGCWEGNAYCGDSDLNKDGIVNFYDFLTFASRWQYVELLNLYNNPLDTNPNWNFDGEWGFGQPMGLGAEEQGNPDPESGFTGNYVFGVNLDGDYDHKVTGGPYYLIAGPFDLGEYYNVSLRFARWLNTDMPEYVASSIEVSTDGQTWHNIWLHDSADFITDDNWIIQDYPLGSVVDYQNNVYIRWSYEIVDGSRAYPFSGWNIDDIELWGNPISHN